jgi:hypothetical protein
MVSPLPAVPLAALLLYMVASDAVAQTAVAAPRLAPVAETMPPAVAAALARHGFGAATELRQRGDLIVAEARRDAILWRIVIDARSGELLGLRALHAAPETTAGDARNAASR